MTKDLKYANTSNRLDTGQLEILKDKKVKYGIRQIRNRSNTSNTVFFQVFHITSHIYSFACHCMLLYGIAWNCIILQCIVWYCMAWHCFVWYQYCILLYSISLYCMPLHCIVWYWMVLHDIVWYRIVSYQIIRYCMVLHLPLLASARGLYLARHHIYFMLYSTAIIR